MLDLIAVSLWTDSTRCVSYMLGNSNSRMIFDFLGISEQHHYLSHFFRNFSRPNLDALLKISLWHMEKFDSLMNRLKGFSIRSSVGSLRCTFWFRDGHSIPLRGYPSFSLDKEVGDSRQPLSSICRESELGSPFVAFEIVRVDVTRFGESQMPSRIGWFTL